MKHSHFVTSAIIGIAFLFWANMSFAYIYGFESITCNNAADVQIGETQLSVEVLEYTGNEVVFWFENDGSEASSIEGVYFDDGSLLQIAQLIDEDDNGGMVGVDFTPGANPPDLPGGNDISPEFNVTSGFLSDSDPPTSHNGVNPNEILGIVYGLETGKTIDDVVTELARGDLRIGIHVIAFDSGGSESFVNTALVPIPGAAFLFIPGLGLFALIRRKAKH